MVQTKRTLSVANSSWALFAKTNMVWSCGSIPLQSGHKKHKNGCRHLHLLQVDTMRWPGNQLNTRSRSRWCQRTSYTTSKATCLTANVAWQRASLSNGGCLATHVTCTRTWPGWATYDNDGCTLHPLYPLPQSWTIPLSIGIVGMTAVSKKVLRSLPCWSRIRAFHPRGFGTTRLRTTAISEHAHGPLGKFLTVSIKQEMTFSAAL